MSSSSSRRAAASVQNYHTLATTGGPPSPEHGPQLASRAPPRSSQQAQLKRQGKTIHNTYYTYYVLLIRIIHNTQTLRIIRFHFLTSPERRREPASSPVGTVHPSIRRHCASPSYRLYTLPNFHHGIITHAKAPMSPKGVQA